MVSLFQALPIGMWMVLWVRWIFSEIPTSEKSLNHFSANRGRLTIFFLSIRQSEHIHWRRKAIWSDFHKAHSLRLVCSAVRSTELRCAFLLSIPWIKFLFEVFLVFFYLDLSQPVNLLFCNNLAIISIAILNIYEWNNWCIKQNNISTAFFSYSLCFATNKIVIK